MAERHRIYGDKYDGARRTAYADARPVRRAAAAPVYAAPARPVPTRPAAVRPAPAARPAPVAVPPAKSAVVAKAPVTAKPVLKPVPALKPAAPVTAAAPLDPKLAQLQTSLAPQVSSAATLAVAPALSQRLEGPVVLTLPQNLFDLIRQEAAKLGLGRAARASEATATLTGQGYEITPNGPQTAKLKSGQAATFQWQVKPGAGELGPLRAQIDASLRGQRKAMNFSMAAVEKAVAMATPPAAKGFKLPKLNLPKLDLGKLNLGGIKLPNYGDVEVPGIGKTSSRSLIGGGLVLLAVLLLIAIARNAAEAKARARRRRKFRTMADYGQMDPEPETLAPVAATTTTTYHDRDGDGVPDTKVETHEVPVRETERV